MSELREASVHRMQSIALGGIAVWLVWALVRVNIEFDDGYSTIANAQYFLGVTSDYFWQRGPAMALVLVPAEWLANRLALHPFDVHAHHALMAALHLAYLAGVWRLLTKHFGTSASTLLAWLAAMLTPVFFSYAPFISHDLVPGLLTLLMVRLGDRFVTAGGIRSWLALVATGAVLALIKQTYALVWVSVLMSQAILLTFDRRELRVVHGQRFCWMLLAACLGGVATWAAYAAVLGESLSAVAFWWRPLELVHLVSAHYDVDGGPREALYQWVYLRNLGAYGVVAIAMLLPGLYLSVRHGDRMQRSVAISWLLLVLALLWTPFKEVRYLAFLAPLNAWLLVPALKIACSHQLARRWLPLVVALDVARALPEALRLESEFYRSTVTAFLDPLPSPSEFKGEIVVERTLSFVSPDATAFYGDRYHRITHIGYDQIRLLYGYSQTQWRVVPSSIKLTQDDVHPGDYVLMSTEIAVHRAPYGGANLVVMDPNHLQAVARVEELTLVLDGASYRVMPSQPGTIFILPAAAGHGAPPLIGSERFSAEAVNRRLVESNDPPQRRVLAFRVLSLCRRDGCREAIAANL